MCCRPGTWRGEGGGKGEGRGGRREGGRKGILVNASVTLLFKCKQKKHLLPRTTTVESVIHRLLHTSTRCCSPMHTANNNCRAVGAQGTIYARFFVTKQLGGKADLLNTRERVYK